VHADLAIDVTVGTDPAVPGGSTRLRTRTFRPAPARGMIWRPSAEEEVPTGERMACAGAARRVGRSYPSVE